MDILWFLERLNKQFGDIWLFQEILVLNNFIFVTIPIFLCPKLNWPQFILSFPPFYILQQNFKEENLQICGDWFWPFSIDLNEYFYILGERHEDLSEVVVTDWVIIDMVHFVALVFLVVHHKFNEFLRFHQRLLQFNKFSVVIVLFRESILLRK